MVNDRASVMLSSLGEGVLALDAEGRITFSNKAARTALGWSERQLLGRDVRELVLQAGFAGRQNGRCSLLDVIGKGGVVRSEADVFRRRNGSTFAVAYTASAFAEDPPEAVVVFVDISDRRRVEQEVQERL